MAAPDEIVSVRLSKASDGQGVLSVSRPRLLSGTTDKVLCDAGNDDHTMFPDAPLLGLSFTLRLVDKLARDAGGQFLITPDEFVLYLLNQVQRADLPATTS